MSFLQKISNVFSRKTATFGGFNLLSRLTGTSWSATTELEAYEKSLYVFACVSKIAEKVASIDLDMYQIINSKGDTKELNLHPALDLLYRPNAHQTHEEFVKITVINLRLTGDAFWFKVRNERGQVVELWNLRPDMVEIIKDPELFIKAYKFTKDNGTTETIMPEDIVHFRNPSPLDEYLGISSLRAAQTRIDTEEYASKHQRDFFLNSARPDAVFKSERTLTKETKEDIRDKWQKKHAGVGNNSKIAILEGGLEYQQISLSQREMDFIESMKFTRDDILVAFGVPKTIVAITDDVNRANAETAMYVFLSETIKPAIKMIVEKINEMLIYPEYGENMFIDFDDPTPQNRDAKMLEYTNGLTNGWLTINEVRGFENLPPIAGGDLVYMPISNIPIGGSQSIQDSQNSFDEEKRAFKKAMRCKTEKLATRNLRGKYMERMRIKIAESAMKEVKNIGKNTEEVQEVELPPMPKGKPLITDEFLKKEYANIIIKRIDRRAESFKTTVNQYAEIQKVSLLAKIASIGDLTKSMSDEKRKAFGDAAKKVVTDLYKSDSKVWASFSLPFLKDFVEESGNDALGMVAPDKEYEISAKLEKALASRAREFGLGVNRTTRDRITNAISEGIKNGEGMASISDRITQIYDEFPTWRGDLIARTEATAANNEGSLDAYKQSDVVTGKEWIATMDDRTRDEHLALNGEIVKTNEQFSNGLMYPQEPNCRCVIAPAVD